METVASDRKTTQRVKKLVDSSVVNHVSDEPFVIDEDEVVVEFDARDYLSKEENKSEIQVDHLDQFTDEELQRIMAMDGTGLLKDSKVQALLSQLSEMERMALMMEWNMIDSTDQQPVLPVKHLDVLTLTTLWEKAVTQIISGHPAKRMVCEAQHCRRMLWVKVSDFEEQGIVALVCADCRKKFT